jgi:hypothetical protein
MRLLDKTIIGKLLIRKTIMGSNTKGRQKYLLSASISQEVGKILDEKNEKLGIVKSFEVEQALRRYYGIELLNRTQ